MIKNLLITLAVSIDPDKVGVQRVEAEGIIPALLGTAYWAAGITAVVVLIIGGILYTVSDGDSSKIKRAKDMILYAVIGLVFVMMAFVVTTFIIGRF